MKRILSCIMLCIIILSFAGCGSESSSSASGSKGTVDLTELSSTMVYSEVYEMMVNPSDYVGKTIIMNGQFAVYGGTDKYYPACIVQDATACCSQGIEFLLRGDAQYPKDYPEPGTEIEVTGTFETYTEEGSEYVHLVDADLRTYK